MCQQCDKPFLRRLGGKQKCCSLGCSHESRKKKVSLTCTGCKKTFERHPSKLQVARHGHYFCSRKCKEEAQSLDGNCPAIRPGHYGTAKGRSGVRKRILKKRGAICCDCGETRAWLITIHHVDGDVSNSVGKNLEVVCGNCHIKRHLKDVDGKWGFDPKSLTPRDMLSKL